VGVRESHVVRVLSSLPARTREHAGAAPLELKAVLDAAPDGVAVVDEQGTMLVVNEELCALFGYGEDDLVGAGVEMLVPPGQRGYHVDHRSSYVAAPSRRPMGLGMRLMGQHRDGNEVPIEVGLSPVVSGGRTFTVAVVRDMSERARLQAQEEAERRIIHTEEERYRIGMDLHDGVMQDIYGAALGLEMALEVLDTKPDEAAAKLDHAIDQLHAVVRDIRSYIFDLRPRQFAGEIDQAFLDLGREFQDNSSIRTEVRISPGLGDVGEDVGVALYVIAHEALSNIRKYSGASSVEIELTGDERRLRLTVSDDGRGFETAVGASEEHRGLRNMASRASCVGGDLRIQSAPGRGTLLVVDVGLSSSSAAPLSKL
jgi:PAS domain S-box-containing protein